ncbi:MAG: HAD family hydrolase [Fusobacteriaceae bacterium]|jgi:Cof subfamily protein (haloacid dehalogenase superfamily)|nr:HAD family hydrolase [Fusobacteriaceae bacterium]
MIKLVASDLDGTLLNEASELTPATKSTIAALKRRGIHFAIASGRSRVSAIKFQEELGVPMYLICNNGANIYDESGAAIYLAPMSPRIVGLVTRFLSARGVNYNGFDDKNLYIESRARGAIVSLEKAYFDLRAIDELAEFPAMTKLLAKGEEHEIRKAKEELTREAFAGELDITISHPRCLDVVDRKATKENGIRLIAENLGIAMSEVMAFGDADNDLGMLLAAGHPVAMGGSMLHQCGRFEHIAASHREDGVARYLREFFQLEER